MTSPGRAHAGEVAFAVHLDVAPDRVDEFVGLLEPLLDTMRHEPTFINAVVHCDPADPARFMIYETWADLDDVVEVQLRRPYRQAYEARLPALLRAPRRVETWRPVRGDFAFFAPKDWR
jgi:quinol monooxygenase YgiN